MRAKDIINEDWQKVNKKDKTDGMSQKAVNAYRRENPGSKLKTAVTTKPSKLKKGGKAAKRRSSYCSRSAGQMDMHNISCAKTPDKAICKARRRWNCEEDVQQLEQSIEEAKKSLRTSNPCWKGYHPVGTKKKSGKTVPNCVPNESINEYGDTAKGQKMLTKVQKRAVDRVVSKKADTDPKYAKKNSDTANRAWERMTDKDLEEGKTQKQETPKPRNFVAKNAINTGAGAHKDKKKAAKQGDVKHKGKTMDLAEMESSIEEAKASLKLCKSSKPDDELGASQLASCKSQGLRSRDGNKSHKLGKSAKSRVKVGGHKIKGQKYGGPLPDWS
jgi:hypothetical protein